jgi:uncharacterized membrane protein YphA (DoxX/SURF4 family)
VSRRGGKAKKGRAKAQTPTPLPLGVSTGLVVLRLWAGGFFLVTAWWKLIEDESSIGEKIGAFRDEYVVWIERAAQQPPELFGQPLGFYADFLEGVMLPGAPVLAPLILGFEVVLGLSLVLGLGVRLTASLGVVMMLAFNLAKPQRGDELADPVGVYLFTVRSANWPVTLILLMLALAAAGRVLGLDVWLRARGPLWLRWIG